MKVGRELDVREIEEGRAEVQEFDERGTLRAGGNLSRPVEDEWYADESFVEATSLVEQTVIAEGFSMVTGEDDDCILSLSGSLEVFDDSCELIVDEGDHGIVEGLDLFALDGFRRLRFGLEIYGGELFLGGEIVGFKVRSRELGRIEALGIRRWRNEGRMRIVGIDVQHPGFVARAGGIDEFNRLFAGPGGLMKFLWHSIFAGSHGVEIAAAGTNPLGVVMAFFPVVPRGMAELPEGESIVESRFGSAPGTLEVEFAN